MAFSDDGVLIYLDDSASGVERLLSWIDREGNETSASATRARFRGLSLSPDGKRVALEIFEENRIGIWILELERDILSRLTLDSALDRTRCGALTGSGSLSTRYARPRRETSIASGRTAPGRSSG